MVSAGRKQESACYRKLVPVATPCLGDFLWRSTCLKVCSSAVGPLYSLSHLLFSSSPSVLHLFPALMGSNDKREKKMGDESQNLSGSLSVRVLSVGQNAKGSLRVLHSLTDLYTWVGEAVGGQLCPLLISPRLFTKEPRCKRANILLTSPEWRETEGMKDKIGANMRARWLPCHSSLLLQSLSDAQWQL